MSPKKIEIFVDLNRAGHNKSVKKNNYRSSTNIYKVMADLQICFSCRHKSHLLRNLMLKFIFKNYKVKLNYQILNVGIHLEILVGLP